LSKESKNIIKTAVKRTLKIKEVLISIRRVRLLDSALRTAILAKVETLKIPLHTPI
jgi:hypothetical protein